LNSIESKSNRSEATGFFPAEPYVTADDIAAHLKITRRQVLEMTRRGLFPAHPLGVGKCRRVWRYKISEVENAIASGVRKPASTPDNDSLACRSSDGTMRPGSSPSQRRKSNG
jgi:Helix-turn-helix domain